MRNDHNAQEMATNILPLVARTCYYDILTCKQIDAITPNMISHRVRKHG